LAVGRTLYPYAKAAGPIVLPITHVVIGAVIRPDAVAWTFPHPMGAVPASFAFQPNWNTTYYVTEATDASFTVRFGSAPPPGATLSYRLAASGGSVAVTAAATSKAITHNLGSATPGWQATPNWNTTVYLSEKAANVVTFKFGTPAPDIGAKLYYGRFNTPLSFSTYNEEVTTGRTSHTTTHNLARLADTFVMPNWNTTHWLAQPLDTNTTTIRFNTPAPTDSFIDVVSGVPEEFTVGAATFTDATDVDEALELVGGEGALELVGGGDLELV
jgi:hypothetical protein